ncbi:MAG: phosphoenolpyruvate--protein phosphotransferase [Candidatus Omnitrophota bacterium]
MNEQLKGIPAAPGVAIGKAFVLKPKEEFIVPRKEIADDQVPLEIARLEEALIDTRHEILEIQKKISQEMGVDEAQIFEAHLLVIEDRMLIDEIISRIKRERLSVEYVFSEALKKYIQVFSKIEDEYLRERVADISDVGRRVLQHLLGKAPKGFEALGEGIIIVAHDLSPSDTASMYKKSVLAFATDIGGRTSHTAIMAKSLEIPAVVGVENATVRIRSGDLLIVDGSQGIVVINPDENTVEAYRLEEYKFQDLSKIYSNLKDLAAQTKDGKKVKLAANIELPEEIPSVIEYGAEGIGLYRTEYFYMNRKDLPSEEEHFAAYKAVIEKISPHSVIIRTIDLGGDKFLSSLSVPRDMLPFLGWRAIRFCLARPDIFKTQLRAILRASAAGEIKIMYPMISGLEELQQANALLDEAKGELRKEGKPFDEDIQVGAMIEVPSAAMICDILAEEANFFSIGTNDLIQYSLAVDRTNEKIAYLYEPAHPAVLRLIKNIIDAGHQAGVCVGMCGEMAGEPELALLLLGLGLDEFSVSPSLVPKIKHVVRSVTMKEAQGIAKQALTLSTGTEVEEYTRKRLKELLNHA